MGKELLLILSMNYLNYQLELGRQRSTRSTSSLLHLLADVSPLLWGANWSIVVALSGVGSGLGSNI